MADFSKKVVLVTGGAAGIGEATVRALALAHASIFIADIDPGGARLAASLGEQGHDVIFRPIDVTSASACREMVNGCVTHFGRLDVAINNVGLVDPDPGLDNILTADDWDQTISLTLSSTFYCVRAELEAMLPAGGGTIVNTASVGGLVSLPRRFAYVSAKHGVVGLTKAICDFYANRNIRCNAVAPGLIETPGLKEVQLNGGGASISTFAERIPMGRLGTPEEIAQAILWLASDDSSYVNGTVLAADGGYLVR